MKMPYTRHVGVVASMYDNAFKQIISAGWAEKTEGTVDSPIGHLALIPIPYNEHAELADAIFRDIDSNEPVPPPGYYIAQENGQGFITVYSYDEKWAMEADWANAMDEYNDWYGSEEEMTPEPEDESASEEINLLGPSQSFHASDTALDELRKKLTGGPVLHEWRLNCLGCGEEFEDIQSSKDHESHCGNDGSGFTYEIKENLA
jgi:hypothetical protein